jgi:hypothetical protein
MAAVIATQAIEETMPTEVTKTENKKKQGSKDLQKTRLCVYNLQGKCGFGSACSFAHSSTEIRGVPDLRKTQLCPKFAEGKCSDENCSYAHGEEELRESPNLKKKMCKWALKGTCRNGAKCGFAHGISELQELKNMQPPPGFEKVPPPPGPPPGLEKMGPEEKDWEVSSTEAPPSQASKTSGASHPDAPFFHLAAARGAAPMKQQVKLMSSAVTALQAKLAMLEDMVLQQQVVQMQQQIQELNEQCWALESGLYGEEAMPKETTKSRLSAKATPFVPCLPGNEVASSDSTSVGSDSE